MTSLSAKFEGINSIAFAGGGSGGHCYPLLAIAAELKRRRPETKIFFVTMAGSIEERILEKSGYPFHTIPSGKVSGQGLLVKILTLLRLPLAFWKSFWILIRERPQLVMSAGGYAGAPFLAASAIFGLPCAIYEQNRQPGLAIRLMANFAKLIFLNFSQTEKAFTGKKSLVVGLPFRKEILSARWTENEFQSNLMRNPFRIFIFGGSQGAVGVNRLVANAIGELGDLKNSVFVHHQTGQNDLATVEKKYRDIGFANLKLEPFVHDMASAYRAAHLVICRAGASSLAELAAAGKAAILIPLVSKDDHQTPNAQELAEQGAAVVMKQNKTTGADLASVLKGLILDRNRVAVMAGKMALRSQENAEDEIIRGLSEMLKSSR